MSECVVRMEMPECCDECPIEYDGFMCGAIHKRFYPKTDGYYLAPLIDPSRERLPDCPILCQLPEGHGRLVDADDFIKHLSTGWENGEISNSEWCDIRQWMNEETTIVPAEAERSET